MKAKKKKKKIRKEKKLHACAKNMACEIRIVKFNENKNRERKTEKP